MLLSADFATPAPQRGPGLRDAAQRDRPGDRHPRAPSGPGPGAAPEERTRRPPAAKKAAAKKAAG